MKLISIVTPCYNEEDNVENTYRRVKALFESLGQYRYEHLFIDNCSRDGTVEILRRLAAQDKNVKVIVNSRNFGHIRSPMHAFLQTRGDAVIPVVADLQDPLSLIPGISGEMGAGREDGDGREGPQQGIAPDVRRSGGSTTRSPASSRRSNSRTTSTASGSTTA